MDKEPRTLASLRQIRYNGAKKMKEVPKMEQNDHNLDNTPLLRAIARMQTENSRESREAVLDLVISQAQFLARDRGKGGRPALSAADQSGGTALLPRLHWLGGAAQAVRPQKSADGGPHL